MPSDTDDGSLAAAAAEPEKDLTPAPPANGGKGAPPGDGHAPGGADALLEELEKTRAERDRALRRLDAQGRRARWARRGRHFALGILVVLFAVLLPVSITAGWARGTVMSTDGWVSTVGPVPSEPAVAAALGTELTNQIFSGLQVRQQVASVLPPRASFLAGPLTNGVRGYVEQGVTEVIASPQFRTLWVEANRFAHAQLVAVLEGNSQVVSTTGDTVVLNLVPLLNAALHQFEGVLSGLVGRPVTLPAISASEVPAAACARLSSAIGVSLPSNCAQVALFPADKLTTAQQLIRRVHRWVNVLFVVTPLVAVAALLASDRRRRTLLQLLGGGIIGVIVFRRAVAWLDTSLTNTGNPANKAARQAILAHVLHGFFAATTWVLVGFLVAAVLVAVTGPYPWARNGRHAAARLGAQGYSAARAATARVGTTGAPGWVVSHVGALQLGGLALALILLLTLSVSFVGFLVMAGVVVLYEVGLQRVKQLGPPAPAAAGEAPPPPPPADGS